jgi:hypothetical protein
MNVFWTLFPVLEKIQAEAVTIRHSRKVLGASGMTVVMLGDQMELLTFSKMSHEEDVIIHIALDAW